MTCVETASGDGNGLPPMFIFAAAQHMEQWFLNDVPDNELFAVSKTGYTDDEHTLAWLTYFERHSSSRQAGVWRLLILDGYGSHCTFQFVTFCDAHKIIPLCFPAHATHLMQPLDVVVFQPYKHYHAKAVDNATRTGCSDFNKVEFLAPITSIRHNTFKCNTIRSAFRLTGLIPYDLS